MVGWRFVLSVLKQRAKKRNQGYLLTLSSMKHHQAVTLPTLGWSSELPQLVGLSGFGHLSVSEGPRGAGCFNDHLAQTCRVDEKKDNKCYLKGCVLLLQDCFESTLKKTFVNRLVDAQ